MPRSGSPKVLFVGALIGGAVYVGSLLGQSDDGTAADGSPAIVAEDDPGDSSYTVPYAEPTPAAESSETTESPETTESTELEFDPRGLSDNQIQSVVTRGHEAGFLRPTDAWSVSPQIYPFLNAVLEQCDDVRNGDDDWDSINSRDQGAMEITSYASHHFNDFMRDEICPSVTPTP